MFTLLTCHILICSFNIITCCVSDNLQRIVPGAFQKYWDWFFVGQKATCRTGPVRKIDKGCSAKREKDPQYASGRWKNWNVRECVIWCRVKHFERVKSMVIRSEGSDSQGVSIYWRDCYWTVLHSSAMPFEESGPQSPPGAADDWILY